MFQAWKDGKPITKPHYHRETVMIELIEKGYILISKNSRWLLEGVTVRVI